MIIHYWYSIPKQARLNPTTRKRYMAYGLRFVWIIFFNLQLLMVKNLFTNTFRDLQWMIALIAPLMKEINDRIIDKLIPIYAPQETLTEMKFIVKIHMNVFYALWLATSFSILTAAIEYILLAISFCNNIFLCYKVIQLHGKTSTVHIEAKKIKNMKEDILTELILNETVEILLPIAFIGTFASAFYGPNKNKLWHIGEMENLMEYLLPIVKMALIDSGSLILAGIFLRWFCRINILREYCCTIKKYWIYLAFWGGSCIASVSNIRL